MRSTLPVWLAIGVVFCALHSSPVVAQEEAEEPAAPTIAPAQGIGLLDQALSGKAKPSAPKADVVLLTRGGVQTVVRVLSEIGSQRLVKLPTGELEVVEASDTKPTTEPFVAATRERIIARLKGSGFRKFRFASAGYYLYCYDSNEALYAHTRSILGTLLPGVVAQLREWGLNPVRPDTPLVVIIMPSRKAFDALEKMDPEIAAYYNQLTNQVVLYQDTKLWDAAPEYAFRQAAYTVAHEGIHQILANTGVQQRLSRWPQWVSEGLPEYFCPLNVNTRLIKLDQAELPERTLKWQRAGMVNDLRMYDLLHSQPQNGALIREAVSAPNLSAFGYAVSWGLVHTLSTRKSEEFAAYLADVSKSAPLRPVVEPDRRGPDPLFVKHFGDEFGVLEAEVQRHLTSSRIQRDYRDPVKNQTHYVVKSIVKRGRVFHTTVMLTRSPASAKEWKESEEKKIEAAGETGQFYTIV